MGSQKAPMDVIFDTASDWLVVEGELCTSCQGDTYKASESTAANQVGTEYGQRIYGNMQLLGFEWTDQVCITEVECVSDFEFFLVSA